MSALTKLHAYIDQIENGSTAERRAEKHRLVDAAVEQRPLEKAVFDSLNCPNCMCGDCVDRLIDALGDDGTDRLQEYRKRSANHRTAAPVRRERE